MERVVVTGIGLVSSLGQSLEDVTASLREGRSGIVRSPEREGLGFRSPLTGRIEGFDPRAHLSRRERRSMGEPSQYAAVAALRALDDAALERSALAHFGAGVIIGNDSVCGAAVEATDGTRAAASTRKLGSAMVVKCMNSSPNINLSVLLGTRGACWTVAAACASGAQALGQAWGLISSGQQDVVVCGGTQELNWHSMAAFDALGTFSTYDGEPQGASRPFSHDRDGLVPSGGAAVMVLESEAHAHARRARVRAELVSYAFSSDGYHVTSPSGKGAAWCIRRALEQAGIGTSEVEYVNAHAASTPVGDRVEAGVLGEVFGDNGPPVSSTKSLTGHECWMAGASEVAYSLLMSAGGFIAPNANFAGPDEGFEGVDIVRETRDTTPRLILSNSFGFGGTNACIVLRAPDAI